MDSYTVLEMFMCRWPQFHTQCAGRYFDKHRNTIQKWCQQKKLPSDTLVEMICKHQGSRIVIVELEGVKFPYRVPNPVQVDHNILL